jgi:hypothetical protein
MAPTLVTVPYGEPAARALLDAVVAAKQGDALNWLVSEVFGLRQARSRARFPPSMFAALRGLTLKDFIIQSIEKSMNEADRQMASSVLFGMGSAKENAQKRKARK